MRRKENIFFRLFSFLRRDYLNYFVRVVFIVRINRYRRIIVLIEDALQFVLDELIVRFMYAYEQVEIQIDIFADAHRVYRIFHQYDTARAWRRRNEKQSSPSRDDIAVPVFYADRVTVGVAVQHIVIE